MGQALRDGIERGKETGIKREKGGKPKRIENGDVY